MARLGSRIEVMPAPARASLVDRGRRSGAALLPGLHDHHIHLAGARRARRLGAGAGRPKSPTRPASPSPCSPRRAPAGCAASATTRASWACPIGARARPARSAPAGADPAPLGPDVAAQLARARRTAGAGRCRRRAWNARRPLHRPAVRRGCLAARSAGAASRPISPPSPPASPRCGVTGVTDMSPAQRCRDGRAFRGADRQGRAASSTACWPARWRWPRRPAPGASARPSCISTKPRCPISTRPAHSSPPHTTSTVRWRSTASAKSNWSSRWRCSRRRGRARRPHRTRFGRRARTGRTHRRRGPCRLRPAAFRPRARRPLPARCRAAPSRRSLPPRQSRRRRDRARRRQRRAVRQRRSVGGDARRHDPRNP